jgi:hypothetical protein
MTIYSYKKIGTAIGSRVAITYAKIYMSAIDILIQYCAEEGVSDVIYYYKQFIDDTLVIWAGSQEQLEAFLTKINKLHPTIKFTRGYDKKD